MGKHYYDVRSRTMCQRIWEWGLPKSFYRKYPKLKGTFTTIQAAYDAIPGDLNGGVHEVRIFMND